MDQVMDFVAGRLRVSACLTDGRVLVLTSGGSILGRFPSSIWNRLKNGTQRCRYNRIGMIYCNLCEQQKSQGSQVSRGCSLCGTCGKVLKVLFGTLPGDGEICIASWDMLEHLGPSWKWPFSMTAMGDGSRDQVEALPSLGLESC